MKQTFKQTLAVLAAIAAVAGGGHMAFVYLDTHLTSKVRSVVSKDLDAIPTIEMVPELPLAAKKK